MRPFAVSTAALCSFIVAAEYSMTVNVTCYSAPAGKRSTVMSICLSVLFVGGRLPVYLKWPIMCWCAVKKLLTHLSLREHISGTTRSWQSSPNFLKKCMLPIAIDTPLVALRYVMYFRFMGDIILHMMTKNRRSEKFFMIQLCGTYNWPSNVYWWLGVARILDRYSCATLSFVSPQIEFNF